MSYRAKAFPVFHFSNLHAFDNGLVSSNPSEINLNTSFQSLSAFTRSILLRWLIDTSRSRLARNNKSGCVHAFHQQAVRCHIRSFLWLSADVNSTHAPRSRARCVCDLKNYYAKAKAEKKNENVASSFMWERERWWGSCHAVYFDVTFPRRSPPRHRIHPRASIYVLMKNLGERGKFFNFHLPFFPFLLLLNFAFCFEAPENDYKSMQMGNAEQMRTITRILKGILSTSACRAFRCRSSTMDGWMSERCLARCSLIFCVICFCTGSDSRVSGGNWRGGLRERRKNARLAADVVRKLRHDWVQWNDRKMF